MEANYPERPRFFAQKFIRMLVKTCVANEYGAEVFSLLVTIAVTEDAKRYQSPVTFFNEQLMPIIGVRKWETLDRIRLKAIAAKLLHYIPPPKGQRIPGSYWVIMPLAEGALDDTPVDEPYPANGYATGYTPPKNRIPQTDTLPDTVGGILPDTVGGNYQTIPIPNPSPTASAVPPTPKSEMSAAYAAMEREVLAAWNSTPGVRQAKTINDKRRKSLRARLSQPGWAADLKQALAKFPLRLFAAEPEGWQPDFDWIVRPDTVQKILEGNYDWEKTANGSGVRQSRFRLLTGKDAL